MGEVRWTLEAARWLHEIHDYIAQDNPEAALRTVRGIHVHARAPGAASLARCQLAAQSFS